MTKQRDRKWALRAVLLGVGLAIAYAATLKGADALWPPDTRYQPVAYVRIGIAFAFGWLMAIDYACHRLTRKQEAA